MGFAAGRLAARPLQQLPKPRNSDAEPGECRGAPQLSREERRIHVDQAGKFSSHVQMEDQTQGGGEQARPDPSENSGDEHGRNKEQVKRLAARCRGPYRVSRRRPARWVPHWPWWARWKSWELRCRFPATPRFTVKTSPPITSTRSSAEPCALTRFSTMAGDRSAASISPAICSVSSSPRPTTFRPRRSTTSPPCS